MLPALTAAENVAVPLLIESIPWEGATTRAKELLEAIGLGERSSASPTELSGGQQQGVAIARALAHDPALIVCDEPTSNLDHENRQTMMEVLRGAARRSDRTIIVVTHDPRIFGFAIFSAADALDRG